MAQFIRPEAQALLLKWREVLVGLAVVLIGVWWIFVSGGLLSYLGLGAVGLGAALTVTGVQRSRFRGASGGPGSVDVDEGQVSYFGPLTGGMMPLRDMDSLTLIRSGQSPHWLLTAGHTHLHIPVNADGVDALFDAFASLPGLKSERLLRALNGTDLSDTVIWQRAPVAPRQLHS